jgi:transcriptional regulator with PAS, ATPase and Fis domain
VSQRRPPRPSTDALVTAALGTAAGAAIVLDAELRVVVATTEAERICGGPVPVGLSAPAFLCGGRPKRPLAEALAAGRAVEATIPRPSDGKRMMRVRAAPIVQTHSRTRASAPLGWLITLEDAGESGSDESVLFHGMWTRDPKMKELFRLLERAAAEDVTVLVRGETGSGKELVAQAVHACSRRAKGPFRALNCAALPGNLLESELFGHAKGSFTGAVRDMPGHVQLAHKGTLFLDEVAELPLDLQAKLLRVLETRTVIPVGAREPLPVDVRIVSATHRALRREVEAGRFRADLMYRLRVIPIFLPALRERPGDIPLLVEKLVVEMNGTNRRTIASVSEAALEALVRYPFPGNVRELRNVLAYAYVIGDGPRLELSHLPPEVVSADVLDVSFSGEDAASFPDAEAHDADKIRAALVRARGSREQAAKLLGLSRVTLWRRMRELGIEEGRKRKLRASAP